MINKICEKDLENSLGEELSVFLKEKIKDFDLSYMELDKEENNDVILEILKYLYKNTGEVTRAGQHRIGDWEKGWSENSEGFLKHRKHNFLIPKYFGKYPYIRWNKKIIKPCNKDMEYNLVSLLQYWIFEKFIKNCANIYEFGCGTGHNLLRVNEVNPEANVFGLDWATSSQQSIENINKVFNTDFKCNEFDFFNPNYGLSLEKDSGVYTFAALEQIGDKYEDFINFLLENNPKICFHIEPISEYLDDTNLYDFLSKKYFEKRNYLKNFKNYMHKLEKEKKINIIFEKESFIGSMYINGYSIIAWEKVNA